MKHWLIAGGSGLIGQRLASHLQRRGDTVTILSRNPKAEARWDNLAEWVAKSDVIVNLAGENLFGARWSPEVKQRLVSSRVDTTKAIVDAIRSVAQRPAVLISASAVGYYGDRGQAELTEDSAPSDDFLARLCVDWEDAAKPAAALGVRVVAPRIGVVLDAAGGAVEKMKLPFLLFGGGPLGSGRQFMPWIHADDLCRLFIWAAETPTVAGPLNATAPNPVTMTEFASAMGKALRRPSWFPVPGVLVNLVAGEASAAVLASQRAFPRKAINLGFEFEYPEVGPALTEVLG
ncbi:MAG: hypothetical protein RL177_1594 [Bacteroidota bacterium]